MNQKVSPREFWDLAAVEAAVCGAAFNLSLVALGRGTISSNTFHVLAAVSAGLTGLGIGKALWETHKAKRPQPCCRKKSDLVNPR